MGVRPSMGSVGDAYDNAMAESQRDRANTVQIRARRGRHRNLGRSGSGRSGERAGAMSFVSSDRPRAGRARFDSSPDARKAVRLRAQRGRLR